MLMNQIKKLPVLEQIEEDFNVLGILSLVDVARLHPELVCAMNAMVQEDMVSPEAGFYVS
jgi:signal-transduction protein with cAMP-binding, CBS, and nucleotidyltransferase domain